MNLPPTVSRPAHRLPEPYQSELLSIISSMEVDGPVVSVESEERAVQRIEADLANGGRERRRLEVERHDERMRNAERKLPVIVVRNTRPRW